METSTTESHECGFDGGVRADLKVTFGSWFRLGLLYNAILLMEGLACSWDIMPWLNSNLALVGGYWGFVFLFGLVANVFYCLGPLIEGYVLVFLKRPLARARLALWSAGLLFSMLVVFLIAMGVRT